MMEEGKVCKTHGIEKTMFCEECDKDKDKETAKLPMCDICFSEHFRSVHNKRMCHISAKIEEKMKEISGQQMTSEKGKSIEECIKTCLMKMQDYAKVKTQLDQTLAKILEFYYTQKHAVESNQIRFNEAYENTIREIDKIKSIQNIDIALSIKDLIEKRQFYEAYQKINQKGNNNEGFESKNIKENLIMCYQIYEESLRLLDAIAKCNFIDGQFMKSGVELKPLKNDPKEFFQEFYEKIRQLTTDSNNLNENYDSLPLETTSIYGLSANVDSRSVLCRFDIREKKLYNTHVKVPSCCNVLQITKNQMYLTGGNNVNTCTEYNAENSKMNSKAPMVNCRFYHCAVRISQNEFVVVGGYNGSYLKDCERYDITTNSWNTFAELSEPKYWCRCILLNNKYIYCFGGYNGSYSKKIERVTKDGKEKQWVVVDLKINEPEPYYAAAAYRMTNPNEILIFRGSNTAEVYLYNMKEETVKRYNSLTITADYFEPENGQYQIGDSNYILGHNGHFHIMDIKNMKYDVTKFIKPQ